MSELKENNILSLRKRSPSDAVREAFGLLDGIVPAGLSANSEKTRPVSIAKGVEQTVANDITVDFSDELRDAVQAPSKQSVMLIGVSDLNLSPYQTREIESDDELEDLKQSIQSKGIIQPLIVRRSKNVENGKKYELVAGERRFRAAILADLQEVPAIVLDLDDRDALEISIIENAQREDLNPIEEAYAYKQLTNEFNLNQTEVAQVIGKSRAVISNSLRLLNLEEEVIELIKSGELSSGHGRILLQIEDPKLQVRVANKVAKNALSVRALENIVARIEDVEEAEESDEEEEKLLASIKRQESKIKNLLEMEEGVNLKFDSMGNRRLTITFDSETSWRKFMGRIKE